MLLRTETIKKEGLVVALAAKASITKVDAEKFVNGFVATVEETLARDDKIQLVGFGTFEVKTRAARTARNPRTGEEIKIAAAKVPAFKAGKALKDIVNK